MRLPGNEVSCLLRDAIHKAEKFGHVFTEWNQVDFVVAVDPESPLGFSITAEFNGSRCPVSPTVPNKK